MNPNTLPSTATAEKDCWRGVIERSRNRDGAFLYGVRTTGVYCRSSYPSRRPQSSNVQYFRDPLQASAAEYRACRRCAPDSNAGGPPPWVLTLCRRLERTGNVPPPRELAQLVGLTSPHVQRTSTREAGVSPHQYGKARRLERLSGEIRRGTDVTSTVYDAGFNSDSVAYDQARPGLGMTPRLWREGGRGEEITHTVLTSDLGSILITVTATGLVTVRFGDEAQLIVEVRTEFPLADLRRDDELLAPQSRTVLAATRGTSKLGKLPLEIAATAFQARVRSALQVIPRGATRSYADVATMIGEPTAVRAVASTSASNPVAPITPCHRVVRTDGSLAGCRWGLTTKEALLEAEGARPRPRANS